MPITTIILDDWNDAYPARPILKQLEQRGPVRIYRDNTSDDAALLARLADAQAVVLNRERTPFHTRYLEQLPNLRVLCQTGSLSSTIDPVVAGKLGVAVTLGPGHPSRSDGVVELALAFMLALARRLPQNDAHVRAGIWNVPTTPVLQGKTMGILGLGHIGKKLAAVGQALGMKVIAWGPTLDDERAAKSGVERVSLEDALRRSDALFPCTRLSDLTRGLIGAEQLALMKPTAWLINTARGPITDEAALVEALRNRQIGGAGLDVFNVEPLPAGHPLTMLDNVILTPHIGWASNENMNGYADGAIAAVLKVLDGDRSAIINAGALVERH